MDEQSCPRCKTTKYRNPQLILMVNTCGHSLCSSCVDLLFTHPTTKCPECGTLLRRSDFRRQLFEDPSIDKEVAIRRDLLKIYNRREENFKIPAEYNDYLEEIENHVYNYMNNIEVEETKRKVEKYKKSNEKTIAMNRYGVSKEEAALLSLIDEEKRLAEVRQLKAAEETLNEKTLKRKNTETLIDALSRSDMPANHIVASHKMQMAIRQEAARKERSTFSTGIAIGNRPELERFNAPRSLQNGDTPYVYEPLVIVNCGPAPPSVDDISRKNYLKHVRCESKAEMAGGYLARLACQRALEEAFCALYVLPEMLVTTSVADSLNGELMDVS